MEIAAGILLGIGLAASSGFRVFLPLLITSIASQLGYLHLSPGFEWMGSWIALVSFATASVAEITAYYIPWLDNALDTISGPLAMIAGTVLTASFLTDVSPLVQWTLGIIVGGGTAGIVKVGASAARLTSTATTGGMGNAVVATSENILSVVMSIFSFLLPLITAIIVVSIIIYLFRKFHELKKRKWNFFKKEEEVERLN
ncbi:MAG TPA: DUF4126 domain-containing protein [Ignavibacteria bacterium]|nr:DUF4126 domain-containing protein [Ignavibacteria bacterium]